MDRSAVIGAVLGGSLSTSLAATQAVTGQSMAPAGLPLWLPWCVSILTAFGPLLLSEFIKWRKEENAKQRAAGLKLLSDKDKSNDAQGRELVKAADRGDAEMDLAEKLGEKALDVAKHLPLSKK